MFRDILVPILGRRGDMDALNAGAFLAESHSARLTVLQMVYQSTAFSSNWAMARKVAGGDASQALRAEGEAHIARLRTRLESESFPTSIKLVETSFNAASRTVAQHALHADLTVVAGAIGDTPQAGVLHAFLANLFLASSGPVMVVPPRNKVPMPPRRIVVAWRSTREAGRALHDAMPLLRNAENVDVVIVDPSGGSGRHSERAAAALIDHLAQHGVAANLCMPEAGLRTIGSVLLDHVRQTRAGLLVAGSYGHSRLRESMLGGVTRELLVGAHIPVFYSH